MKLGLLLVTAVGLLAADREGNFKIRFEPVAKLQTQIEVPFEIHVTDARQQPVRNAVVTFSIAQIHSGSASELRAYPTAPGVYVAKPVFSKAGQWTVEAIVRHDDAVTRRTIPFSVPQ